MKAFSVAIDGPVASGKGTLAEALAKKLEGHAINTGGMYRAVALYCIENNIELSNVINALPKINVDLNDDQIFLNGKNVTDRIKEPDIAAVSSILAAYSSVRRDLARRQYEIAERLMTDGKAVFIEGRDIGTRVLPNADLKIFLTADPEIRARRRYNQYTEKGLDKSFEEVLEETKQRDYVDSNRETDPLPSNPKELGYWVLDDSGQSESETIQLVLDEIEKRGLRNG